MIESVVTVLMRREGITKEEAQCQKDEFQELFGRMVEDECDLCEIEEEFSSWFALEPDYLEEFIF